MRIDLFIQFIFIPFAFAATPLIWILCSRKEEIFGNIKIQRKTKIGTFVCIMFLVWSYYSVWSVIYGPMSKEDWGPGIVQAIGLILFQVIPLVITLPVAFWVTRNAKT